MGMLLKNKYIPLYILNEINKVREDNKDLIWNSPYENPFYYRFDDEFIKKTGVIGFDAKSMIINELNIYVNTDFFLIDLGEVVKCDYFGFGIIERGIKSLKSDYYYIPHSSYVKTLVYGFVYHGLKIEEIYKSTLIVDLMDSLYPNVDKEFYNFKYIIVKKCYFDFNATVKHYKKTNMQLNNADVVIKSNSWSNILNLAFVDKLDTWADDMKFIFKLNFNKNNFINLCNILFNMNFNENIEFVFVFNKVGFNLELYNNILESYDIKHRISYELRHIL